MAFTTPATFVANDVLTAAQLNTYLRDNVAWLATDSPSARVYHDANQSLNNTTETALSFNSERFDNASVHSTSSNTSRLTIPSGGGGKYLIGGAIVYEGNATGVRGCHMRLNATTDWSQSVLNAASSGATQFTVTTAVTTSAADYWTMIGYQSSGGALNVTTNAKYSPEFFCFWFRT